MIFTGDVAGSRTDKTMSALGLVRGRGPQDTSHCGANDAGDCGKDGAKRKFCSAGCLPQSSSKFHGS